MSDSEELRQKKIKGGSQRRDACCARYSNASMMCLSLLRMNYDYDQIIERLQDEYGYSSHSAKKLLDKNKRKLKQTLEKKYDKIADENVARLEAIIDECYAQKRYTEMLKAVDIMGKLTGAYTTRLDINANLNNEFVIKIRED